MLHGILSATAPDSSRDVLADAAGMQWRPSDAASSEAWGDRSRAPDYAHSPAHSAWGASPQQQGYAALVPRPPSSPRTPSFPRPPPAAPQPAGCCARGSRSRTFPYLSSLIAVGCLVAFGISIWQNGGFQSFNENPLFGPSTRTLVRCGAKEVKRITEQNEWWRLLSPSVLHGGVIHLVCNMQMLSQVGPELEKRAGRK
jgi:hypothetical protein